MKRRSGRAAVAIVAVFLVCTVSGQVFAILNGNVRVQDQGLSLAFIAFTAVGALVASRRPDNVIGWLFCAVGLLAGSGVLAMEYAEYVFVTDPSSLPGGTFAAWYSAWFWYPLIGLTLIFPIMLFPTGRTLSARWRPLLWLAAASISAVTILGALTPTLRLQDRDMSIDNPVGIAGLQTVEEGTLGAVLFVLLLICVGLAFVQLVIRFRRSTDIERQQLKVFTFATAFTALAPLNDYLPGPAVLSDIVLGIQISLPPIAAGIAILRYRLFDIDRIISKTIVYATVTGALVGIYVMTVAAVGTIATGASDSLTVAVATLAAAAAFRPFMRRIQSFVDRRFYRRKYDAQRTVEEFGSRLRQETDLGYLTEHLAGVVSETMQPAHVSIWLRQPDRGLAGARKTLARAEATWQDLA